MNDDDGIDLRTRRRIAKDMLERIGFGERILTCPNMKWRLEKMIRTQCDESEGKKEEGHRRYVFQGDRGTLANGIVSLFLAGRGPPSLRARGQILSDMIYRECLNVSDVSPFLDVLLLMSREGAWKDNLGWLLYRLLAFSVASERHFTLTISTLRTFDALIDAKYWRPSQSIVRRDMSAILAKIEAIEHGEPAVVRLSRGLSRKLSSAPDPTSAGP